jgi:hypothetical protein
MDVINLLVSREILNTLVFNIIRSANEDKRNLENFEIAKCMEWKNVLCVWFILNVSKYSTFP